MNNEKKRDLRLDFIRIFSIFSVISVHFFLNTGFYDDIILGKRMYLMTIIRSFFMICVPMFITLTGYLMHKKTISKKYYKGIIKVLVTYILCSIIYFFFSKYYLKEPTNIFTLIFNILSYIGLPNAWYVEMYIGLFILIPFLNIICNNIEKKQFKLLLFSLLILISIPGILNIYKFNDINWWSQPSIDNNYIKIFPSWWSAFYPLLYYFLGAYLSKYAPEKNIKTIKALITLAITVILNGTFSYYRSHNSQFIWGSWNNYDSLFVYMQTFLVFNLLLKININIKSKTITKIIKNISDSCFGAYLLSYIFDYIIYTKITEKVPIIPDRFKYFPVVIIIFILSISSSFIIEQIRIILFKIFNNLKSKITKKINN